MWFKWLPRRGASRVPVEAMRPALAGNCGIFARNCDQRRFWQDMVHSAISAYLTLHLAQVLLRADDPRCMGDGQHVRAAAEWVMLLSNCSVRKEPGQLLLTSGLVPAWLPSGIHASFGQAPTPLGDISIDVERSEERVIVSWQGARRGTAPPIEVRLLGYWPARCEKGDHPVALELDPVR